MSPLTAFIGVVSLSLVISSALVAAIAKPLRALLEHLCPGVNAASFWVAFTAVMLYITPLLFAAWTVDTNLYSVVKIVKAALSAELFGAFAALLVIGYQIAQARPGISPRSEKPAPL
jgi:hypothetical protein